MILYPAVDIRDGQCVRLRQGEFHQAKVYSEYPVEVALRFEAAGATYLHVVDLDGAVEGRFANKEVIQEILGAVQIPVQTGGGIRSIKDIEERFQLGIARVILGTGAVKNPELVKQAVSEFGADRIIIGIDAKDGMAAISGWEKVSKISAVELALRMREYKAERIIYTDIARDGMLSGPNVAAMEKMISETGMKIIASGGVSSISDLLCLSKLSLEGIIVGKALYENKFDLAEAIKRIEQKKNDMPCFEEEHNGL